MTTLTFGARLREYRRREGLTQQQLGDVLGLDFTYISKIEGNKVPAPAREHIEAAAKELKLSADEREELFTLAERLPADLEAWVAREPAAHALYRSIARVPADQQQQLLASLIARVREETANVDGAGPDRADGGRDGSDRGQG